MTEQEVKPVVKKKAQAPELEFKLGLVFSPEAAKDIDAELDAQAAVFKAKHGQAGTRRIYDGPGEGYNSDAPYEWMMHYNPRRYGPL
jgi:hypothetical protein